MFTRAVHFGSCLLLQSVFVILFLVAIPAWKQAGGSGAPQWNAYQRKLQWWLRIGLATVMISGFFWLWCAIAGMSGSSLAGALQPGLFGMVLSQTPPGRVWLVRAGVALLLAGTLPLLARGFRRGKFHSLALLPSLVLAGVLTASLAWLGHAGAGEGPWQNVHLAADVLHLLAAGIWPAGLLPFALLLRGLLQQNEAKGLLVAVAATRRFSALSLATVGTLALSGLANSYFLVGTLHALLTTDYGRLLLLKLALFAGMLGLGAWNLLGLKPRLAFIGGAESAPAQTSALHQVARNVLLEISLGTLILLVVGLLGMTPPVERKEALNSAAKVEPVAVGAHNLAQNIPGALRH